MKENEITRSKRGVGAYLLIVLGLLAAGMLIWFILSYNTLVAKEEAVKTAWSQVESNLQRKVDLLPNLVKTVKAYAKHERDLYTKIAALRAQAASVLKESSSGPDETRLAKLDTLQKALRKQTARLFAVAENYPVLRSSEQFLQLQSQIEGAENRINITRMQFNEAVGDFNRYMRTFPASIVAGFAHFRRKAYFKAAPGSEKPLELNL
ncbi:LemA family protein [Nitratifractor salsuginis]|uniref:LemA family protein n=1 Tax=Nitratifractor salsuginis (strain DSM 16511 / JCM 12458 / E9I37-1) TaxID=749222 RepID=E6X0Y8_NITSE|nr:LemA family protein [Nitratifractor salsuginis]ADV46920.1 LemA family protein [Nitratifractor salsuginis DSM 16511]